jgi:5-(carboxyamino)imidazole ribonucleotide synthase
LPSPRAAWATVSTPSPPRLTHLDAVREFTRHVHVVTFEFENIPVTTVDAVAEHVSVRPSGVVLHTTQHRLREKTFLARAGFPVTPFRPVSNLADLQSGVYDLGLPAVLKTAGFGYDGKGQSKLTSLSDGEAALRALEGQEAILEAFVDFEREVSVVAARGLDGTFAHYGVIENAHRHHILDVSIAPAVVSPKIAEEAVTMARAILEALDVVGVLCVEFFLTRDGKLLVNELAPRPHNSGHFTVDACVTSQFEQQLRAVCGLPLGSTAQYRPAAMANLLGDLWQPGEPCWQAGCAFPDVKLHVYGKLVPRPGRKMGHLTALATSAGAAAKLVCAARTALQQGAI